MSTKTVLQFMEQTGQDEQLRQQLEVILGVGDGDISSAQEIDVEEAQVLKSIRGTTVAGFAAQKGFTFTPEELTQVVDRFQQLRSGQLSEAEFAAALGLPQPAPESQVKISAIQRMVDLVYRGIHYTPVAAPPPEQAAARREVIQFMEGTASDEARQQQLQSLIGVGDGDISSLEQLDANEIAALKGQRGSQVVDFAAQQGYSFSVQDLSDVVDAFQRLRSGDLSEAAFAVTVGIGSGTGQPLSAISRTLDVVYRGVPYVKSVRSGAPQTAAVLQFMERTAKDTSLRDQLKAVLEVGDGDISGAGALDPEEIAALQSSKGERVTEFASQKGYLFTVADLNHVATAYQQVQSGELSEEDFTRAIGLADANKGRLIKKAVTFFYRGIKVG